MTQKHARFMANNYCDAAATVMTYSSQLSAFPMSNVLNAQRSKVAKFAGNFTIDATNNKLYVNDGSDKTATLTTGSYTYATLAAHVQTQLNAVSSAWTCTYDFSGGTFKFTIGHTGSATLRLTQTTSAAWDALGYTGVSDRTGTSFAADEPRNHTEEWIKFHFLTPRSVDFAAVIAQIDRAFSLSSAGTAKLQLSTTDSWASPAAEVTFTRDDRGLLRFQDDLADTSYEWARLYFRDRTGSQGPEGLEIGRVWLGDYETFTTTGVAPGFKKTIVDPSDVGLADGGAEYFRLRPKYRLFSDARIGSIPAAERRVLEDIYDEVGKTTPFFLAVDPGLAVSASLHELSAYVRFTTDALFENVIRDVYSLTAEYKEVC